MIWLPFNVNLVSIHSSHSYSKTVAFRLLGAEERLVIKQDISVVIKAVVAPEEGQQGGLLQPAAGTPTRTLNTLPSYMITLVPNNKNISRGGPPRKDMYGSCCPYKILWFP